MRVNLSKKKCSQIEHVLRALQSCEALNCVFPSKETLDNQQLDHITPLPPIQVARNNLQLLDSINICTAQLVFNYELRKTKELSTELMSSIQGLDVKVFASRKKCPYSGDHNRGTNVWTEQVTEICINTKVRDFQLKTLHRSSKLLPFIKPFKFSTEIKMIWMPWTQDPYTEIMISSDIFTVELGPEQIFCFTDIYEYLQLKSDGQSLPKREKMSTSPSKKASEPLNFTDGSSDSVYQDDLRAGIFQYIKNSNHTKPKPYQIIFDDNSGTMIWRYPEPRALTRVDIYPVPFVDASALSSSEKINDHGRVTCALQFYDSLRDDFVTYRQFQLSESELCQLELPSLYEKQHVAVAAIWRVWIDYSEDESQERGCGHLLVPATALAACIRIDSIFSIALLPQHQLFFSINKLELSLQNHMKLCGKAFSPELEKFRVVKEIPDEHEFLAVQICGPKIRGYSWTSSLYLELSGCFGAEVLNYGFLTNNVLLEQSAITVKVTAHDSLSLDKPRCVDLQVFFRPIFLHICQSTVHTLSLAQQAWEQAFDPALTKKSW